MELSATLLAALLLRNMNQESYQFLRGHTEVELMGLGYTAKDIWVHCLGRRGIGSYDMSLEDLRAYMFKLIQDAIEMDIHRFWPTFGGDWSDLVYIFYQQYLQPKCRYNGKKYYFDGDYAKAAADGIPYMTLIDRYANSTHVSFETYVRGCVKNRLLDGIRGGVKGYSADGRKLSIDAMEEAHGASTLLRMALYSVQDDSLDSDLTVWSDARVAKKCFEVVSQLRNTEPAEFRKSLRAYIKMRSGLEPEVKTFFDYVFEVPDVDEDDPAFRAFVSKNKLDRYFIVGSDEIPSL